MHKTESLSGGIHRCDMLADDLCRVLTKFESEHGDVDTPTVVRTEVHELLIAAVATARAGHGALEEFLEIAERLWRRSQKLVPNVEAIACSMDN